jgi:hypothetical protein
MRVLIALLLLVLSIEPIYSSNDNISTQKVLVNGYINETQWNRIELIDIFSRKRISWPNGKKIVVFTRRLDTIEHKMFVIDVLNLTPFQFKSKLNDVIFSGQNTPVVETTSDEDMLLKISMTPYSIGYINSTVIINDRLNVVKVTY